MNAAYFRRLHRRRPLRPFVLRLADGSEIPVDHPENMTVSFDGSTAVIMLPREGFEIIDLPLTAAIDFRKRRPRN